jgi:hypothetical protein
MAEKDFIDELDELEDECGACTPLSRMLDNSEYTKSEVIDSLPILLLIGSSDDRYLQDIKDTSVKYPWLIPYIISADLSLRGDSKFPDWVKRVSNNYKAFIESISGKQK